MFEINPDTIKDISRKYEYSVRSAETDSNDQIHIFNLLSMIQEAASIDAEACNLGANSLDQMGYCWMLLRTSVRLKQMPKWKDLVSLATWTNGIERLFSIREFVITCGNANIIGAASTSWLLVDKENHKPQKISALAREEFTHKTVSSLGFSSPKLLHWYEEMSNLPTLIKDIGYSEIDRNCHVNNTRYVAWCIDAIGYKYDISSAKLIGLDINYISEVRFGEKIELFVEKIPAKSGFCADAACVVAIIGKHTNENRISFVSLFYWNDLL